MQEVIKWRKCVRSFAIIAQDIDKISRLILWVSQTSSILMQYSSEDKTLDLSCKLCEIHIKLSKQKIVLFEFILIYSKIEICKSHRWRDLLILYK